MVIGSFPVVNDAVGGCYGNLSLPGTNLPGGCYGGIQGIVSHGDGTIYILVTVVEMRSKLCSIKDSAWQLD